jgi:long-chain acyl-CoA synthetase
MTPDSAEPVQTAATEPHPWEKSYPAELRWDAEIPVSTMVEMFKESVKKYGDLPALNFLGKRTTFNELDEQSDRFAKSLQDRGIGKGSHVGLCLPDSPFHVIAYYGALKAGATLVNLNPTYADGEMKHIVEDSECDVIVSFNDKRVQKKVDKLLGGATCLKKVIVADIADALPLGKGALKRTQDFYYKLRSKGESYRPKEDADHILFSTMLKSKGAPAPLATGLDDVAVLQYTGGTTGVPKAAMLTHRNLTANIAQAEMWFSAGAAPAHNGKQKKMLAVLPFFHVFAMTVQEQLSLKIGSELVMLPLPETGKILQAIDKEKPDMFAAVPSMYEAMMAYKPKRGKLAAVFNKIAHPFGEKHDLSSVSLWLTGGAATPQTLEDAWKKHTGKVFTKGYGLSETSPLALAMPLNRDTPGSIGLPVPGTVVRINSIENAPDISDKVLPLGENGEVCVKGPQVMAGYWKRDDETAKVMDKDGFFHTGDTGYIDPKTGESYITGRLKDMINRQGMKVFPLKVEGAMLQHPAIAEVCVVGVPDPRVQEEVKAHIVFKQGQKATPEELKQFLKDRLAPYEIPHLWKIRDSLPKTSVGKPDKKKVREEDAAELAKKQSAPPAPKA